MKIGLLGGTFDPIHRGHLDVAHAARLALELDMVQLVPAKVPPHRRHPHASAAHRFAMVAMAVAGQEGLEVSDIEMEGSGPSYTVSTIERLMESGLSGGDLFLITGADAFRDVPTWKSYPSLLTLCHFVVVSRLGEKATALRSAMPDLADRMRDTPCEVPPAPSIFLVDGQTAPVSSTGVRQAIRDGASLEGLLPTPVAAHIARHRLYR